MWKDTVIVFAADGCRDGVTRALQMMDGIASSVVDDALSHFVSTNNLAALDTLRLASPLADVTRISDVGFSPLMLAASEGQDEAARWCMKHGADVNAQGCFDLTPLMLCAARGYTKVARALLERGAKIHTAFGSAMQDACIEGHLDMVRLFVEYKADVNEVGGNGLTPLLSTIQLNSLQVAEYLLQCGAKVNSECCDIDGRDRDKCTGLVNACELGLEEMVKLFLEYDADVNAANKHGVTALMKALKHGSEPIAKLLLSKNARITRDKRGRTPVGIARKSRTTFTHGLMKQISRLSS